MQSQNITDRSVIALCSFCYIVIIVRFFYFIYICLISMQRHRSRNLGKINLPENFVENFDEEKWLLKQQHEILKTKYKCLKQLFHAYNTNVIGHYKNNLQGTKPKQCLKKTPVEKQPSICKSNISSKISDIEISRTDLAQFKYENFQPENYISKPETYMTKRARTVGIQTDDEPKFNSADIVCKTSYHALNLSGKAIRDEVQIKPTSKVSILKSYIQKVLGQNRDTDKPRRIRNRRHITFNFSKKSMHSGHKNVVPTFSSDNNPLIVSLVEVAKRSCLSDSTLRKCRVYGCGYVCYGIIEYNTHMNLAHYPDRKYICYFCHESFDKACDKFLHENKHLGVKFDLTGGSNKSDCCKKQIKRTISKETTSDWQEEFVDFKTGKEKVLHHEGNGEIRNTILKNTHISMIPSDSTETIIYKTNKVSQIRKPKCPHTISSIYQTGLISDCLSSKNLSNTTNFLENLPKNLKKVSCRFCQKSFDSKCKLLYHIDLKHGDVFNSDNDTSDKKSQEQVKKLTKNLESKNCKSNSKCTDSICLSHMTKKSSKVCSIMNKVKHGLHKYKWEPGTRIIRI